MLSVARQSETARMRVLIVALGAALLGVILGTIAGQLVLANEVQLVAVVLAVLAPAIFWRWNSTTVIVPLAIAVLIEQFTTNWPDATTDRLPLFKSFSDAAGIPGLYLNSFEVVLLMAIVAWIGRGIAQRNLNLPRSHLAIGILAVVLIAVATEVHGIATGGNFNESFWELRPWIYMAVMYLLVSQVANLKTLWAMLWTVVLCSGFKGIQGTYRFLTIRNDAVRPQEILEHIEAIFLSCFIILVIALWLFGIRGKLRTLATVLLPLVVVADLGNQRRAAWVILGAQLITVAAIVWVVVPERRQLILRSLLVLAVASAIYLPVFWNSTGAFGQPARAIHSAIQPDVRDAASNLYRVVEDMNLEFNIRRVPVIGQGFGVPITTYVTSVDLSQYDPSIAYIQHNTVLYQWWRMGTIGAIAFWWLLGVAIVMAARLARSLDRRWALFAAFTIAALIGFVIDGWYDLALANLRAPVLIGCLLGGLEVLQKIVVHRADVASGAA